MKPRQSTNPPNLENVCPICRVYDPSWFVHFPECPGNRFRKEIVNVGVIAAMYRRRQVKMTRKAA